MYLFCFLDTNYDNVVLAKSLHYLVPPSAVSQKMTPSMESSKLSFYQFATSNAELDQKMKSRIQYWKTKNIDPHSIIFGLNIDSDVRYVVVMNDMRTQFIDFLKALDAAYKMFHFFNIPYPPESLKFWSIISVLLYDLKNDLHITGKLSTVIEMLKIHIKKAKSPQRRSSGSPGRSRSSSPAY